MKLASPSPRVTQVLQYLLGGSPPPRGNFNTQNKKVKLVKGQGMKIYHQSDELKMPKEIRFKVITECKMEVLAKGQASAKDQK